MACGLRYLSPRPDSSELAEHYPAEYPPYRAPLSKPSDRAAQGRLGALRWATDRANLKRMGYSMEGLSVNGLAGWAARALAPWRRGALRQAVLSPHGRCRMLEVGCGTGSFLYLHRDLGWETWGLEMSPIAAEVARRAGLRVVVGQVESAELPQGHFDVVVLLHVLEHLEDPVAVLTRLRSLLAPGGRIVIEVPSADAWGLRFWGTYWFGLDLPRHLSHFGRQDLTRLAEMTGHRMVRCLAYSRGDWHVSSLQYWLRERCWPGPAWPGLDPVRPSRLHRTVRPVLARLARGGDVLRAWLEIAS